MKITILPTTGIEFDGKRICLESSADEIKAVLEQPEDEYTEDDITRLFYFESELRFDIDKDGVYWAFYEGDSYAMKGVDQTEIVPGAVYAFKVEK